MNFAEALILTLVCGGLLVWMTASELWRERAERKRLRERWDETPADSKDETRGRRSWG
jgi:hypothetical protein